MVTYLVLQHIAAVHRRNTGTQLVSVTASLTDLLYMSAAIVLDLVLEVLGVVYVLS